MGWLSTFLEEWAATYEEYPGATLLTWGELLVAAALVPAAFAYPVLRDRLPWTAGLAIVVVGAAFVVWFTVVRSPVMDRLV